MSPGEGRTRAALNWPTRPALPLPGFVTGWWLVLVAALALTALAIHRHWTARLDGAAYDLAARIVAGAGHPAPSSLIVAIDDASLARIGAWPWPRAVQADLVARLAAARPAALGLDVLLTEPRPGDALLAAALATARQGGVPVVLPVAFAVPGPDGASFATTRPLALFAPAPAMLGHVNLAPDGDGMIRRFWRGYGGAARPGRAESWSALPAVMLGERPIPPSSAPVLTGAGPLLIAWRGPPGTIPALSAADVLAGTVPADLIAGRHVLVGVTAAGLGDNHAVPVGGGTLMAGVEIQANLLETLRDPRPLRPGGEGAALALALVPLAALFALMRRLPAGWTALAALALAACVVAASAALFAGGLWLSPVTAVLALLLAWPAWAWARLVTTGRYVARELERAAREAGDLPPAPARTSRLDRQLALLELATARERRLRAEHDEVIRLLSHDMRSPQSAILALTEHHGDRPLSPDLVQRVRGHARRTLDLSDGFVHLARAQAMEWRPELLDLAELARDAADAVWAQARERGMALTVEADPEREVLVEGEPSLLARMIENLAGNAVKYGAAGTPVRLAVTAAGARAVLAVINHGPDIAADRLPTLFDRFARAAEDTAGTGLGLAFVATVAARHGGTATATSSGGETCFTVILPLS